MDVQAVATVGGTGHGDPTHEESYMPTMQALKKHSQMALTSSLDSFPFNIRCEL